MNMSDRFAKVTRKETMADHDQDCLNACSKIVKVFDVNGNVVDCIVPLADIYSKRNVTIFFYEDQSLQIMVDDICVYGN